MSDEYIPWDDAPIEAQEAYMERWWQLAKPEPGSIEYLILQMMSSAAMGHGDPEVARLELIVRGLYVVDDEHRGHFSDEGERRFWGLCECIA